MFTAIIPETHSPAMPLPPPLSPPSPPKEFSPEQGFFCWNEVRRLVRNAEATSPALPSPLPNLRPRPPPPAGETLILGTKVFGAFFNLFTPTHIFLNFVGLPLANNWPEVNMRFFDGFAANFIRAAVLGCERVEDYQTLSLKKLRVYLFSKRQHFF